MSKKILGIVIRYSDALMDCQVDTIGEHNKVVKMTGAVFVGKFGRTMGKKYFEICCADDSQIKLIMVKRSSDGVYKAYQADIESAQRKRPRLDLIPIYIRKRKDINCWFKINGILKLISQKNLNKWVTISSGMPLVETLYTSMSGLFYVFYDKEAKFESRIGCEGFNKMKKNVSRRKKDCQDYEIGPPDENNFISLDDIYIEDDDNEY
jgi:hypothetical protein